MYKSQTPQISHLKANLKISRDEKIGSCIGNNKPLLLDYYSSTRNVLKVSTV